MGDITNNPRTKYTAGAGIGSNHRPASYNVLIFLPFLFYSESHSVPNKDKLSIQFNVIFILFSCITSLHFSFLPSFIHPFIAVLSFCYNAHTRLQTLIG